MESIGRRGRNSTTDRLCDIPAAIVLLGCIQTTVVWLQARRLRQTIDKTDEIFTQQTNDIQSSIAQATRASKAMERIAESMGESVKSVNETVAINQGIGETQKLISELQSHAYLAIAFEGMVMQNAVKGVKFEPKWSPVNRGNTPAYDIRFSAYADVVTFPLEEKLILPFPEDPQGYSSTISPGLLKTLFPPRSPSCTKKRRPPRSRWVRKE